jgi:Flp pilus assembly protein TadD
MVSLADLLQAQGATPTERLLEEALRVAPETAEALRALGLRRMRQGRRAEALDFLRRAASARPGSVRFSYVYAVALHSTGDAVRAIRVLEEAHRRRPASRDVLLALATYLGARGNAEAALGYAAKLAALAPDDPEVRSLVESLRRQVDVR